ncbi:MAG: potassium transporter TrkG, partial [bacterium]|nr:potassium transporter TrkG [bacterium]
MRTRLMLQILGALLVMLGCIMVIPMAVSLYYGEQAWRAFLLSIAITISIGLGAYAFGAKERGELSHREGFAIVTLGWVLCAAAGALPYIFDQTFPNFVDAYFEAMSGFTTTGSTVLKKIEGLSMGILFWRSMT